MNPIRVQCPSCQGKLVIRSEKHLGQIVPCPRCKHLVQVPVQPSDVAPPPVVDSQALTSVDLVAPTADAPDQPPRPSSPTLLSPPLASNSQQLTRDLDNLRETLSEDVDDAKVTIPSSAFEDDLDSVLGMHHASPHLQASELTLQIDDFARNESAHDKPQFDSPLPQPSPAEDWQTPASNQRKVVLLGGLAGLVLLLSVALLFFFLRSVSSNGKSLTDQPGEDATAQQVPATTNDPASEQNAAPANQTANGTTEPAAPIQSVRPEKDKTTDQADTNSQNTSQTGTGPSANVNDNPLDNVLAPDNKTASETVSPTPESSDAGTANSAASTEDSDSSPAGVNDLSKFLENLPKLDSEEQETAPKGTADEESLSIRTTLPESMLRLAPLIEAPTVLPDAQAIDPSEVDGGSAGIEQEEIKIFYHPAAAVLPDWPTLLEQQVTHLRLTDKTLLETLYTLESVYGITIDWDIHALRYSQIDLTKKISLDQKDVNLNQVLTQLLAPYNLKLKVVPENWPTIEPVSVSVAQPPEAIDLTEWITPNATAEQWLQFFQLAMPQFADRFALDGSNLSLPSQWTTTESFQFNSLLTQIRQIASGDELTAELKLLADADRRLRGTGNSFSAYRNSTPVMLERACREFGFSLIIDWQACWDFGLTPANATNFFTKGRTLEQISRFIIEPFALLLLLDEQGRLVLTTPPTQRQLHRLLLVPLAEGQTRGDVRSILATLAPFNEEGQSILRVVQLPDFSPKRKWCAALVCAPSVKQLSNTPLRTVLQLPAVD